MQKIKTIDIQFYCEVGKKIRHYRQKKDMTLLELSKATGISRSLLDHWELGYSKIKPTQFKAICKVLDIDPNMDISITMKNTNWI